MLLVEIGMQESWKAITRRRVDIARALSNSIQYQPNPLRIPMRRSAIVARYIKPWTVVAMIRRESMISKAIRAAARSFFSNKEATDSTDWKIGSHRGCLR